MNTSTKHFGQHRPRHHLVIASTVAIVSVMLLCTIPMTAEDSDALTNQGSLSGNLDMLPSNSGYYTSVDVQLNAVSFGSSSSLGWVVVSEGASVSIGLPAMSKNVSFSSGLGLRLSTTSSITGVHHVITGVAGGEGTVSGSFEPYFGGGRYTFSIEVVSLSSDVTFISEGSVLETVTVSNGETVDPPTPSRTGYTFGGWCTDPECDEPFDLDTPIESDLTLYAKWTINTYTVTFISNGGMYRTVSVDHGSTVSQPTKPVRTGYVFGGWFTNSACTQQYSFSTPVTANMTLYAKWTVETYTVSLDTGDGSDVPTQFIEHGSTAVPPSNPSLKGYVFDCWSTSPDTRIPYDFNTPVTSDLTLYAVWVETLVFTTTPTSQGTVSAVPAMAGTILCDATGSRDYTSLLWDLGDGTLSTDNYVTHYYDEPGTYTVTLTTYNSQGADVTTFTVEVPEAPGGEDCDGLLLWIAVGLLAVLIVVVIATRLL